MLSFIKVTFYFTIILKITFLITQVPVFANNDMVSNATTANYQVQPSVYLEPSSGIISKDGIFINIIVDSKGKKVDGFELVIKYEGTIKPTGFTLGEVSGVDGAHRTDRSDFFFYAFFLGNEPIIDNKIIATIHLMPTADGQGKLAIQDAIFVSGFAEASVGGPYNYLTSSPGTPPELLFSDVPSSHPFFTEIEALAASGIVTGYTDGTFRPSTDVTRMAMAAFLYRALELPDPFATDPYMPYIPIPSFSDVPLSHPFFTEIEALAASGITTGYEDGTFRPSADVTRMAMAAFLYRALELPDPFATDPYMPYMPSFSDVPSSHTFFTEIEALAASGITTGYEDGTFRPSANVTRMAMAAFLVRGLDLDD